MVSICAQRSTAMMSAPSSARRVAWLLPCPRAAPVMNATFPSSFPILFLLLDNRYRSVRAGEFQDVLADVSQDQIVGDGRHLVEPCLPELPLDVVLRRE